MFRRLRSGREHPRNWNIVQINGERVAAIMAARRPVVLVTAHFHHAAELSVGNGLYPCIAGKSLNAPVPAWRFSPKVLRERLQNHLVFGIGPLLEGADDKQYFPPVGDPNLMPAILADLAKPDGCVRIYIDAIWDHVHAHRRPFAGMAERGFALGAARIARLAQCPVILEICVNQPDGSVLIEWGPYIDPPNVDDTATDAGVMDQLIDAIENAIGRYPEQYLHPIGDARRWNADTGRWEADSMLRAAPADKSPMTSRS